MRNPICFWKICGKINLNYDQFFSLFWLHNTAQPLNSRGRLRPTSQVSPASPPTSQSAAPSPAAEKSPRPPSGSAVAATTTQSGDSSTVQQPSAHQQTAAAPPASSSPSPDTAPPPATSATPVSSVTPLPATVLSPSAAAAHARFGRSSKYATTDSPRMLGVKCVVDFEKIYRYLSMIHKPDWDCHLTAMGKTVPHHSWPPTVGLQQTFLVINMLLLVLNDMTRWSPEA